jgi:peroxiredoxin
MYAIHKALRPIVKFQCLCSLFAAIGTSVARAEDPLPRYKLKVGQELVYRTTDPAEESDGGKDRTERLTEWIIDVVDRDMEGKWRLVFRETISRTYVRGSKETKQEYRSDGYFHLTSDGRFVENQTIRPMSDPTVLFPTLPATGAEIASGWEDRLELDATQRKFRAAGDATAAEGPWRFLETPESALDPIYQMSTHRDYAFDRQLGLVRKVVSTFKQGWPASEPGKDQTQTIEFVEGRQLDTSDVQAIAAQARVYFAAIEEYEATCERARREYDRTEKLYAEAEAVLKKVDQQLTLPWLREMTASRLKQHQQDARFGLDDARAFATLVDKPSPDWKTTDLDGNPRGLADYRGKVVVLDFWYRGCGWCVRAMPQMKQLTDDFSGQEVAILGMNSDRDENDARFVIDLLKLNYATLKNGENQDQISTKYKIHGWPTLVVIDRNGVVRHMHFGYTPTLRKDLAKTIRELLAEPAG